jgi:hypothetical protein
VEVVETVLAQEVRLFNEIDELIRIVVDGHYFLQHLDDLFLGDFTCELRVRELVLDIVYCFVHEQTHSYRVSVKFEYRILRTVLLQLTFNYFHYFKCLCLGDKGKEIDKDYEFDFIIKDTLLHLLFKLAENDLDWQLGNDRLERCDERESHIEHLQIE